jgi:NACalpha-BTF3-like transcription factor
MEGPMEKGINRVSWNLRRDAFNMPRLAPASERGFTPQGPEVPPGQYSVKIKAGKTEETQRVDVLPDPRVKVSPDAQRQNYKTTMNVGAHIEVAAEAVDRIQKTRKAIDLVMGQIKERKDDDAKALKKASEDLKKALSSVADEFIDNPERVQGMARSPNTVSAKLGSVLRSLSSSWDAPTPTQLTYLRQAEATLENALKDFNKVFLEDVVAYKAKVEAAKLSPFPPNESLSIDWKPKKSD